MQLGSTMFFTATAVNGNNSSINPAFTFSLTPTSPGGILEISPSGNACAGSWNAPYYSVCTPAGVGVVQVTASALGATSPPTTVFVHPPVDNIQISVVPPVNQPPAACATQIALPLACQVPFNTGNCTTKNGVFSCSCLSQNQTQTLQATAYSQGVDISPLVGPVTWNQANVNVVTITPITTSSANVPTNQATMVSSTPGATQVIASVSGVSSQPYIAETCPVQCIEMEVSQNGTQNPTETNFVTNKGTSQTITATAVDVQGCVVPKPALTWTSSSPAALTPGTISAGCSTVTSGTGTGTGTGGTGTGGTGTGGTGTSSTPTTCVVATTLAGGAAITASCTPPTCNVGFPLDAPGLPALYLPQPVYPVTAISGLATGASTSTNVLATSQDCYSSFLCTVALYNISTSKNLAGTPTSLPTPPNSLMFDPAGDKAYAGSQYGAFMITSSNLGSSSTNPFTLLPAPETQLGVVTGKVIGVSPNGNLAVFSDTVSTPNQVYVVNASSAAASTTALNINSATTATFAPDNSKAFILGNGGNTLNIYSQVQELQTFPLTTPADAIAFSSSGTFALLAGGGPASNLTLVSTCQIPGSNPITNLPITTTLPATPLFLKMVPGGNVFTGTSLIPTLVTTVPNTKPPVPLSIDFFYGVDSTGIDIIAMATTTSISPQQTDSLCSLQSTALAQLSTTSAPFEPVYINLQKGTFHPINVFVSPDTTQVYIVTSDQGVLVYSFNTQSVSAIPLLNNAAPVAADISADGTMLYVAGTDGMLHYINTQLAADQPSPIFFSQLPNTTNNFCYENYSCTLDVVAVKP